MESWLKFRKWSLWRLALFKQLQTTDYTAILSYSITSRPVAVYETESKEKRKSRDPDLEKWGFALCYWLGGEKSSEKLVMSVSKRKVKKSLFQLCSLGLNFTTAPVNLWNRNSTFI